VKDLKQINSLKLSITEKLNLFNINSHEVNLPYKDGWESFNSVYDYREESKSLEWLAKPIILKKKIGEFKTDGLTPYDEVNKLVNNQEHKVHFDLVAHRWVGGYYNHTTLDIYIVREETDEEFKSRTKGQLEYLNKLLDKRQEVNIKERQLVEQKEKEELVRLKEKYDKPETLSQMFKRLRGRK
jgi:hypothetical protein